MLVIRSGVSTTLVSTITSSSTLLLDAHYYPQAELLFLDALLDDLL